MRPLRVFPSSVGCLARARLNPSAPTPSFGALGEDSGSPRIMSTAWPGRLLPWAQQAPGGTAAFLLPTLLHARARAPSPPAGAVFSVMMEVFSQSARTSGFVIASLVSWVGLFLTGIGFPFVMEALGHFSFLIFLALVTGVAVFIYAFLPETKGKSILEITEELRQMGRKNPVIVPQKNLAPDHTFCTKL